MTILNTVFIEKSNIMCNDVLNNCVIINGMNKPCHESLIRLYEAAIEAKKIDSEIPTDLAKLLNVSAQTITANFLPTSQALITPRSNDSILSS